MLLATSTATRRSRAVLVAGRSAGRLPLGRSGRVRAAARILFPTATRSMRAHVTDVCSLEDTGGR